MIPKELISSLKTMLLAVRKEAAFTQEQGANTHLITTAQLRIAGAISCLEDHKKLVEKPTKMPKQPAPTPPAQ